MAKLRYLIGIGLVFHAVSTIRVMPYQSRLKEMPPDTNERTIFPAKLTGFGGKLSLLIGVVSIPFYTWLSWVTNTPSNPLLALVTGTLLSPGHVGIYLAVPSMNSDAATAARAASTRSSPG